MPKEEWGVKRVCPTTGKRFYDLGRNPVVSPYTGDVVTLDTGNKNRVLIKDEKDKQSAPAEEPAAGETEDLEAENEVDLGDDVLDDDDDDDNVSLEEIADVGSDEDDS